MTEQPPLKKLLIGETAYETRFTSKFEHRKKYTPVDPKKLLCVIPGIILKLHVKRGQKVLRDQSLLVLEAMKMQNEILSPVEGTVKEIHVQPGQMVTKGEFLLEFE